MTQKAKVASIQTSKFTGLEKEKPSEDVTVIKDLPVFPASEPKVFTHGIVLGAEQPYETVNHPKHYNSHPSGIECIEIIRHFNFNIGAAIKHLWRLGTKPGHSELEDIEKAIWYLQDEANRIRKENEAKSVAKELEMEVQLHREP